MKIKAIVFSLALVAACSGCMSMGGGAAKAIAAASKDPATQKLKFVCPYGSIDWVRIGSVTGQATTINADGSITVTSGTGTNLFSIPVNSNFFVNPK
jgi:hypothetical protein